MRLIKQFFLSLTVATIGLSANSAQAQGVFNSKIANPFVFCKLPKPCKLCQPFRAIHEQLCAAGKPSAQAQQQYQDSINNNQQNNTMNPVDIESQMTPAISSAYNDTPTNEEIERYIGWLARRPAPAPNNNITMAQYWTQKGITNYYTDPSIVSTAIKVIENINQNIVEAVSAGHIPSNPKPWFDNYSSGLARTNSAIGTNPKISTNQMLR
jgi:hypothetical protein